MRIGFYAFILAVIVSVQTRVYAQRYNPAYNQDSATPIPAPTKSPPADLPPTSSTVLRTNSMAALDEKKRLGSNDYVSFRVVEDRDNDSQRLRVSDNGELEVPYIGPVPAQGKTCKELAYNIKAALEKEYYYHATVILALDRVSEKSRGPIYVNGSVYLSGLQELLPEETYTVNN